MRVLAIDTSTDLGSVAVLADGRLLAEVAARVRARHGEVLLPHVKRALALAGLGVGEVDLFAVGLGPGSFTGVRIGVAAAKGLALANDRPLVGVTSLEALAEAAAGAALVAPVLDAHKGEVYAALFRRGEDGAPEQALAALHAAPAAAGAALRAAAGGQEVLLLGDGCETHGEALGLALGAPHRVAAAALAAPRAALVGVVAARRFVGSGADDLDALEPAYVRGADAALPAAGSQPRM